VSEIHEIRIKGRAVSRGIGIGKAVCLFGTRKQFFRREISASEISIEVARFDAAAERAHEALNLDIATARTGAGERVSELLEGHLVILQDPGLQARIIKSISHDLMGCEWAIQHSFDQYADALTKTVDPHLREKSQDLEDVAERLFSELEGRSAPEELGPGSVLVTSELRASTLLQLRDAALAGIVTEHGGWTSHSSILAREFGIPCVTGISHLFRHVESDTLIAVNGNNGEVYFNPRDPSLVRLQNSRIGNIKVSDRSEQLEAESLQTLDGKPIVLRTNTTSIESYNLAKENGAEGIGLYRSEDLIGKYGRIPSEDEQTEEYRSIATATGQAGVRIRTFDIESERRQRNPALGLRAIRFGLQKPEFLIPQLRALLRASFDSNVKVVVPMVTDATEVHAVRQILAEQTRDLNKMGILTGTPEVGAMIEVPAAALLADQIAYSADFLCLGTNDLAQYVLAADRDNEMVSDWFRTLHPAMLRTVKGAIESCRTVGKPFIVCGEMAGSPFYVPVLIGMGADDLSAGPSSIEPVHRVAAGIAFEEAVELVRKIMKCTSADEVEEAVAEIAITKWLHLYPQGFFEQHGR
jgi:phosphotransferase system enzyme I (PtsI)